MAAGKGLDSLLALLVALPDTELVMLGEGPARGPTEKRAKRLGVAGQIEWRGFVADRVAYLDDFLTALEGADTLNGDAGDDWLLGGAGTDILGPTIGKDRKYQ